MPHGLLFDWNGQIAWRHDGSRWKDKSSSFDLELNISLIGMHQLLHCWNRWDHPIESCKRIQPEVACFPGILSVKCSLALCLAWVAKHCERFHAGGHQQIMTVRRGIARSDDSFKLGTRLPRPQKFLRPISSLNLIRPTFGMRQS